MSLKVAVLSVLIAGLSLCGARADLVLQPGPGANDGTDDGSAANGKDASTWIVSTGSIANGGAEAMLTAFNSPCNYGVLNSYLQFSTAGLPVQGVTKAEVQVYCSVLFNGAGWPWSVSPQLSLRRVTEPWNEMTVTAATAPAVDPLVVDTHTVSVVGGGGSGIPYTEYEGWLSFDVTSLYLAWASGATNNHGVEFRIDNGFCQNGDLLIINSSDHTNAPVRPKLVLTGVDPPTPAEQADLVLQPGPGANDGTDDGSAANGKDASTWIVSTGLIANGGAEAMLTAFNSPCNYGVLNSYLQFSTPGLPVQGVTKAEIQVYCWVLFNGAGWPWSVSPQLSLRRVTEPWNEMTVTAATAPAVDPLVVDTHTVSVVGGGSSGIPYTEYEGWLSFDVTSLYLAWTSGAANNHGVEFRIDNGFCQNGDVFIINSSDHTNALVRPKLVLRGVDSPTRVLTSDASFGVRTNRFGFTITGAGDLVVVVEACTNLVQPIWFPVGTNTLTSGSSYFSDPQWTDHSARFYRRRSP